MNKFLLDIPTRLETERLVLRCYQAGDGRWYYAMSQKNRAHLSRYESGNRAMTIQSEEDAEVLVRAMAAEWVAREAFFMGAFDKQSGEFVAQIYVGPVDWDVPEFQLGYFADRDHEGQGYVTEASKAALRFIFEQLKAHRVRLACADTNVRSYRVAERCGMVKEGHFRENQRRPDGTLHGSFFYGLLRGEFENLSPAPSPGRGGEQISPSLSGKGAGG
jgi:RimJ/RimL family protein N-acetyltransferase